MGELPDRRTRKKARTRAEILRAAQQLFAAHGFDAVTIADVAEAADVAVQTVFNHFASKEELFFDGRTPWLEGPAAAVRDRPPQVPPLTALRGYVMELVREYIAIADSDERRSMVDAMTASPALARFDLALKHRGERMLAEALTEAWTTGPGPGGSDPTSVRIAASLVAALWFSGARALIGELRAVGSGGADAARITEVVEQMAEHLFSAIEGGVEELVHPSTPTEPLRPVRPAC